MARQFKDFVETCEAGTPGKYVPYSFRRWAALTIVGAAMQRRVWFDHGDFKVRPNLYVVMIAPPAQGKGIAFDFPVDHVFQKISEPVVNNRKVKERAELIWRQYLTNEWTLPRHMMQGHITYEQLCRGMARTTYNVDGAGVESYPDTSVLVRNSEFGVFMDRYNKNLQMLMTEGWDSSAPHEYLTKHEGEDLLYGPTITWLAGATPDAFVENMPARAGKQGLLSRIIPVVEMAAASPMEIRTPKFDEELAKDLAHDLAQVAELKGEFTFSQAVDDVVIPWLANGLKPQPTDPTMKEYCGRRYSHLIKMSMCFAAGRRSSMVIELEDWESATEMLFKAEIAMPTVLRRFGMSDVGRLADDLVELVRDRKRMPMRVLKRLALRSSKNISDVDKTIEVLLSSGALKQDGDIVTLGVGL